MTARVWGNLDANCAKIKSNILELV